MCSTRLESSVPNHTYIIIGLYHLFNNENLLKSRRHPGGLLLEIKSVQGPGCSRTNSSGPATACPFYDTSLVILPEASAGSPR